MSYFTLPYAVVEQNTTLVLVLLGSIVLYGIARMAGRSATPSGELPLPPGPRGIPLFGNALQLGRQPHLTLRKWHRKYGDIVHARIFNRDWIFLNSGSVVHELLAKRGALYSSRPHLYLSGEVLFRGRELLVFRDTDETWRIARRIASSAFRPDKIQSIAGTLVRETCQTVAQLLAASMTAGSGGISVTEPLHQLAYTSIFCFLYGDRNDISTHPHHRSFRQVADEMNYYLGNRSLLVDYFPWMRYVQWPLYRAVLRLRGMMEAGREALVQEVRDTLQHNKSAADSLVGQLCQQNREGKEESSDALTDEQVATLSSVLHGAGYETTAVAMRWMLLLVAAHPAVQRRLHAELDRVVGRARLPNADDLPQLSYLLATVDECLRFRSPSLFGIPHCTSGGDVYRGYRIPAGATVAIGMYTVHRELGAPDRFQPEQCRQQRSPTEAVDSESGDEHAAATLLDGSRHWAFGAGRRVCTGRYYAELELRLVLAICMWAFELRPAADEHGRSVPLSLDYHEHGITSTPRPFRLRLVPRDEHVHPMLLRQQEQAMASPVTGASE